MKPGQRTYESDTDSLQYRPETSQRRLLTMTNSPRMMLHALIVLSAGVAAHAQGTLADYQRGYDLQAKVRDLVVNVPGPGHWIGDSHRFWYAHSVKGGAEY